MRVGNDIFDAGRRVGSAAVYGIFAGWNRFDVTAYQTKLFGVCVSVYIHVHFIVYLCVLSLLGYLAVFDVFRLTPACQRITAEMEN